MGLYRCLVVTMFMQFYAVPCYAATSAGTTLSVCDNTLKNLYVVNTTATTTLFPTGYVSCANATGSDAGLCDICSCRENKVDLADGVTVVGVVCVASGDATNCVGREQEYCDCTDSAGCAVKATLLQDGFSYNDDTSIGDDVSASSSVNLTTSSESNTMSSSSSTSNSTVESAADYTLPATDTRSSLDSSISIETNRNASLSLDISSNATTSVNPSVDTDSGLGSADYSSNADSNRVDSISADSSSTASTLASAGSSIGFGGSVVENDNVITDVAGIEAVRSTDQDVVHPRGNGSTLGTNSGSSTKSSWSGERLTTVLSSMCGIVVVAAIVVFVLMRRGQSKIDKELGSRIDDFADDDTSMVTPTNHGNRGARYYSGGEHNTDSFENTPLAAIAVIGSDDSFLTPPSSALKHEYQSYPGEEGSASDARYARTVGKDAVMRDNRPSSVVIQQQLLALHASLQSRMSNLIFDSSITRASFLSGMSSQFEMDERACKSEMSFNLVQTSSGTDRDLATSRNSSTLQSSSGPVSSLSSLESVQYEIRDTEASEHMRESEMDTNSNRDTLSFDMDLNSEGLATSA